ncbi:hypothetical protein DRN74_03275 [Candidatus Micrarchaeota archaeon]|nr:MAG: hypothetical protein DRN74_03275 [Candidatus Micrarchaeota archaeon]
MGLSEWFVKRFIAKHIPGFEYIGILMNLAAVLIIVMIAKAYSNNKYFIAAVGIAAFLVIFGFVKI